MQGKNSYYVAVLVMKMLLPWLKIIEVQFMQRTKIEVGLMTAKGSARSHACAQTAARGPNVLLPNRKPIP